MSNNKKKNNDHNNHEKMYLKFLKFKKSIPLMLCVFFCGAQWDGL